MNSTLRWCFSVALFGGSHFNNCVIRDCYFSRDGIGVKIMNGCYGSRIEGTAFEVCAKAAVFVRGTRSFTINNSYFEGNGYRDTHGDLFKVEGPVNTVQLDYFCNGVSIHDNIFRINQEKEGVLISISYLIGGHIYDNTFLNSERAILLRAKCETNEQAPPWVARTVIEHNEFQDIEKALSEEVEGLIGKAKERGSVLEEG